MLEAHRASTWGSRWEIRADGEPLLVAHTGTWTSTLRYTLEGVGFAVVPSWLGTSMTLQVDDAEIARADDLGRRHWTVDSGDERYLFRRRSIWRADQEWVATPDATEVLGSVRRTGSWRGDAVADLPGMPLPTAVFALAVTVLTWELAAAAAAT